MDAKRPEILAPAGDWDAIHAAIENGADAVYFGLQGGFNARARATNFGLDDLDSVMSELHRRGVKGYVTFNTLVFEEELERAEERLRRIALAGADAVIVQDLGIARLARAVSPDLAIHASTQMTVTSAEGAEFARRCGASRVILARELSLEEIRQIKRATDMELEVFVHGALCVSYSGQCLTSEAWGGRSANRGECAQACRLPYDLMVDGVERDLGSVRYLISPQDLAAWELLPELAEAGVVSFKIEGRLKTAEYVANVTRAYRRVLDDIGRRAPTEVLGQEDRWDLEQSFSRGLDHGFLDGTNHQRLVEGTSSKKRGVLLGSVLSLDSDTRTAVVEGLVPVKNGDGIVFEGPDPENEEGGAVYGVRPRAKGVELVFGRERGPDLSRVRLGARVFKTSDPALDKRLRATFEGTPRRKLKLDFVVSGREGQAIEIRASDRDGRSVTRTSTMALVRAEQRPLTEELLREQLGRLGSTPFELGELEIALHGALMLPVSELNKIRRELSATLEAERAKNPGYRLAEGSALSGFDLRAREGSRPVQPELSVLVRSDAQVEAAIAEGVERIYLDFLELVGLSRAIERVKATGKTAILATPRIGKPGEEPILRRLLALRPAGILARHLGALEAIVAARAKKDPEVQGLELVGDFSLNAANALTASVLIDRGLDLLVPSYDLDAEQLLAMVQASGPSRFEVVVHLHLPIFHMEHCVFAALLSNGKDYRDCGRPCEQHRLALRDRLGAVHPVLADVGCRNTVFNDRAQTAGPALARFVEAGLSRFRLELLSEDEAGARRIISSYRQALEGRIGADALARNVRAKAQFGVASAALPVIR
jgi:putative protease